jgi:VanZ family protein
MRARQRLSDSRSITLISDAHSNVKPARTRTATPVAPGRQSRLPLYIAIFCVLVIAYASLQPFSGWIAPDGSSLSFLTVFPHQWTRSDLAFNFLAYVPLGLALSAMWPLSWRFWPRWTASVASALALSILVEALQTWMPTRVASAYDTLANLAGSATGALIGIYVLQTTPLLSLLLRTRDALFVPGPGGDLKILLLVIWLIAQINPGIPLFASTFHPGLDGSLEPAVIAVEMAQTGAALIGIGLFTDLAMRKRWLGGLALIVVISCAIALKTTAAQWFLKPVAWEAWLRPGHTLGLAMGAIVLTVLFWLPRRAKAVFCGVALLTGVLVALLLPDMFTAKAPLSLFSWHYGQLLNLNGLTHTIVLVWPFVATAALLLQFGSDATTKESNESAD